MMKKMLPIWIFLIAVLAAGCGVKTNIVPPDVLVPKAIKDLQGTVKEDTFELTWSVPKANMNGSTPPDLVTFRVLRREETGGCPECPGEFKVRAELDLRTPKGYVLGKNTATWVDKDLKDGVIYMYKIVSINHWGYPSEPSNEVMIKWPPPPPPPAPEAPAPETPKEKEPETTQPQQPEVAPQSPQTSQPQSSAPSTPEGQKE
jgi:hypothetical protein